MAKNGSVIFEVRAEGKNLKVVQRDVDAVASGVERTDTARKKAGKGQDAYNKREKALYQSGLSSSKGFSKMNQAIGGGSSGLVGAYATLAANVFAATAAFQILKEAAQFENLVSGLEQVGIAAGRNLTFAAEKLVEVSGHALSAEKAMRSMALGVSSGFSTDQMERLTSVARGASLALGRDMGDAMDRLTRGAAKLEPEILDELGIMVRLDDATEAYATTLGKTASQLSQFERRQAFLNAILEQGELKFGQLSESIDPNPYDKLAAALANLQKDFISFVNIGLTPFINVLAESQGALVGMVALFGSTIVRTMLPGLNNLAAGYANAATRGADLAKSQTQNLDVSTKLPAAYRTAVQGMDDGTISAEGYDEAMKSLNKSDGAYVRNIKKQDEATKKGRQSIAKSTLGVKENDLARKELVRTYNMQQIAAAKQSMANAVETASQQGLRAGFKALSIAVTEYSVAQNAAAAGAGRLTAMWTALKIAGFSLAGTFTVVAASVMAALGWISILLTVGFLVYDLFKDKLFPQSMVEKRSEKIQESIKQVGETATAFSKTMNTVDDPAHVAIAGYTALQGVLTDFKSNLIDLTSTMVQEINKQVRALEKLQSESVKRLGEIEAEIERLQKKDTGFFGGHENDKAIQDLRLEADTIVETLGTESARVAEAAKTENDALKDAVIKATESTVSEMMSSAGFAAFTEREIKAIKELKNAYKEGNITEGAFQDGVERITAPVSSIVSAFTGARDAAAEFAKEVNKLEQKQQTPFDGAIDAAGGLMRQIDSLNAGMRDRAKSDLDKLPEDLKEQYSGLIKSLEEKLGVEKLGLDDIHEYVQGLKDARQRMIDARAELEKLGNLQKRLSKIAKESSSPAVLRRQLQVEKEIRNVNIQNLNDQLETQTKLRGNLTDDHRKKLENLADETERTRRLEDFDKRRLELRETTNKLHITLNDTLLQNQIENQTAVFKLELQRQQLATKMLTELSKAAQLRKTALESTIKLHNMELQLNKAHNVGRALREGVDATPADELRTFLKFAEARRNIAREEHTLAVAKAKIQFAVLKAQNAIQQREIEILRLNTATPHQALIDEYEEMLTEMQLLPDLFEQTFNAQVTAADRALEVSLKTLDVEKEKLGLANLRALVGEGALSSDAFGKGGRAMVNFSRNISKAMDSANARAQQNFVKEYKSMIRDGHSGGLILSEAYVTTEAEKALQDQLNAGTFKAGVDLSGLEKVGVMMQPMADMFKAMSEMGGENSNMLAAMGSGVEMMGGLGSTEGMHDALNALGTMFNDPEGPLQGIKKMFGEGGDVMAGLSGIAAGIAIVAGVLATVYAIKSAGTADQIAKIDKEIALEKKLGGVRGKNNKAIQRLEAKKELLKRKAFEQNKKMLMAQAMMGTALGMIMAFSNGPVIGAIFGPIIAALGAYQLGIISSMTYQGGGSGGGGGPMPNVNLGSRSNKVDVSRNNVGGELAYMRGERGEGSGASNFTPAFTGYRHRAAGGAAYVVGEQGPELFVPEVPGQIVANDEMEAGGANITANFNIQTIDATTMEETLTTQRGNIINMIREAANNSGEQFLESVDTLGLQTEEGVV